MDIYLNINDFIDAVTMIFGSLWNYLAIGLAVIAAPQIINLAKNAIEKKRYRGFASKPFSFRSSTMSYYWNNKVGSQAIIRGKGRYKIKR